MEFDWKRAVDHYGEELCAIAAQLIVMAGMQGFRMVETLPRHLYVRILSILRPAEYAARRLILMAACKIIPDSSKVAFAPSPSHSLSLGLPKARPEGDTSPPLRRGEETRDRHTASSPPQRGGEVSSEARRRATVFDFKGFVLPMAVDP